PYDATVENTDTTTALADVGDHALIFVPGYLDGEAIDDAFRAALEDRARAGAIIVLAKPLDDGVGAPALALAGLRASQRRMDVTSMRFDAAPTTAVSAFDSPEERDVLVASDPVMNPLEVYSMDPDPAAGTV